MVFALKKYATCKYVVDMDTPEQMAHYFTTFRYLLGVSYQKAERITLWTWCRSYWRKEKQNQHEASVLNGGFFYKACHLFSINLKSSFVKIQNIGQMKKTTNIIAFAFLFLFLILASSCAAIAGIFKAGMAFGIFIVFVIVVIIAVIIIRANKK